MESVMALGRSPCVSPSLSSIRLSSSIGTSISLSLPATAASATSLRHLAAFQSPSHLFSNSLSSRIHATEKKKKNPQKTHIFLPHLVASMEVEESYIMIKPDGVQRGLVGEIISRFEKKGFKLKGLKLFECPKELAEEHYKDLSSKPFFPKLISYITSGPVVCMAWEGVGVVASARKLIGATNPLQAEPGTIRGDLAVQTGRRMITNPNLCCGFPLWFKEGELTEWTPVQAPWLIE
ncbi:Nucleoside diphosphate kinase [Cynara cardunculus var. scolymus]|uniref:nucleoside-diphosphate kinase n=1 Tax=Cynara cardunculus var. scolymus TaxID=59895 RepID=A0A103YBW4_CYNCS|nr:Nucleoside diphosphate kinase [Cynara cardunculus var. scolymus]